MIEIAPHILRRLLKTLTLWPEGYERHEAERALQALLVAQSRPPPPHVFAKTGIEGWWAIGPAGSTEHRRIECDGAEIAHRAFSAYRHRRPFDAQAAGHGSVANVARKLHATLGRWLDRECPTLAREVRKIRGNGAYEPDGRSPLVMTELTES